MCFKQVMNGKECIIFVFLIFLLTRTCLGRENDGSAFPVYYEYDSEEVSLSCSVLLPDYVKEGSYVPPVVLEKVSLEPESVLVVFQDGKESGLAISKTVQDRIDAIIAENIQSPIDYVFEGSYFGSSGDMRFSTPRGALESTIMDNALVLVPEEIGTSMPAFSDQSTWIISLESILTKLGLSANEFSCEWRSFQSQQIHSFLEACPDSIRDSIESQMEQLQAEEPFDEFYVLFSLQYYHELPVFPEERTGHRMAALDDYGRAPVRAFVDEAGFEGLYVNQYLYNMEPSDRVIQLAPFDIIARTVVDKYSMLLAGIHCQFTEARLFQGIWETQQGYESKPLWRFSGQDDDGKDVVVLVDAVSGMEIPLKG